MRLREIYLEGKKKFADIPCPGCGDPKCDHKEEHMDEGTRCWKGYKKKGMKTMFGKRVPNCVKNENTGSPHKGKYMIKTDAPGRKDSDLVIMPDEKAAKDMVASLSKKNPDVKYWVELVENNNWDNPTNDELQRDQEDADRMMDLKRASDHNKKFDWAPKYLSNTEAHKKPYHFIDPATGKTSGEGPYYGIVFGKLHNLHFQLYLRYDPKSFYYILKLKK